MGSSLHSSPLRLRSPRNSSPVNPGGNFTNNLHMLDLASASSSISHNYYDKDITQDIASPCQG